jgi:PAS domain S-box-containing protein
MGEEVPDQGGSTASGGSFPAAGGEVAALIRRFDWTSTGLGPLSAWPQSLKTVTEILLRSPVPIVLLWGADGIMIYNDAYSVFAGGRHPKLLGSKVREGWPEVADFNDNVMKVGLAGGTLAYKDQELTLNRHGRPEQVWMNLDYSPVLNEAGEPAGVIAIVVETTERMMAERGGAESEARFRLIANSAPVPMWVSKLDGTRGFANHAYLEFLGLPYEEAIVFDWRKVLHPEDLDRIVKESIAGEASLKPFVLEARYRRADGAWRWMRSESQPRRDALGNHIGFIGVAHDITAAKQAESDLRRLNETLEERIAERTSQLEANQSQLRAILETSNQYQALLDLDGNVLYANKIVLTAIRSEAADMIGKPFSGSPWFSATPGAGQTILEALTAVKRGESVRTEMLLHLPAGDRTFDFAMRPVLDRHGDVTGILTEAIDITERLHAEETLRQSQKMEAIGQLTGGVAHDFNNLLTIIRSATDFLRRRGLPEDRRRRYVDAISDTVDRASKLTGQLLAFARRQPLKPQVFEVGAQVEGIAQLIRPLVGSRIRIELDIDDAECFALADVAQFETALINLAVNSRDAMEGQGVIAIRIAKAGAIPATGTGERLAGRFVAVSVTDTGVGISPDRLNVIFEPFYTTKEVGKGTGLGLSQAVGFAKQSGGEIVVASRLGQGSTFTIYLPQAETPGGYRNIHRSDFDPARSGRGYRILLVEDNEQVGRVSSELLQDLGYQTQWAADAGKALALIATDQWAFDLVFSDVIMPGMNGVELATLIRERYPHLPVVLTSGYSSALAESAHHGFELIRKPYSVEVLARTLRNAIPERTSSQQL